MITYFYDIGSNQRNTVTQLHNKKHTMHRVLLCRGRPTWRKAGIRPSDDQSPDVYRIGATTIAM
jgi:hypothetical protein